MKNKFIFLTMLATGIVACEPDFKEEIGSDTYTKGEADFSTYVAVGNSLTSGFMDGTMYRSGQQYSFPNLLAQQFQVVGGGVFTQPSFDDDTKDVGGLNIQGSPMPGFNTRMVILMTASGGSPVNLAGVPTIDVTKLQKKAYHNMGVPGAKSFHLLAEGYGNLANLSAGKANPYFVRHATQPNATVLSDAMSLNPTFFTNWIGSNDVLAYATSGGTGKNQAGNLNPATYGPSDITDPNVFAQTYNAIVGTLTSNGAKGVVATIPYVTSIPHFTTVPFNPLSKEALGGDATIDQLNAQLFGVMKQVLSNFGAGDRIQVLSKSEPNALLIKDETLTDLGPQIKAVASMNPQLAPLADVLAALYGQARHATKEDLFVLSTSSIIGKTSQSPIIQALPEQYKAVFGAMGVTFPLEDQYVLIPSEQNEIKVATDQFNQTIKAVAASKGLAVADMNLIMGNLVSGLRAVDGQIYTADYFKGTGNMNTVLFSLDGIHPNSKGYAFVSNEIIKVINQHYKSRIPLLNVASFPGIKIVTSNN